MTHTTPLPDPELDPQFYDGVAARRLVAWCLDLLVLAGLLVATVLASFGLLALIFPLLAFALNLGYRAWSLSRWSATLGMRALGIEIRNRNGDRLTPAEAFGHTCIYVLTMMTILGGVAHVVAILVSARGQGLHDMLLGTVAINRPARPV